MDLFKEVSICNSGEKICDYTMYLLNSVDDSVYLEVLDIDNFCTY